MKKRIAILLLAAVITTSFTACSNPTKETSPLESSSFENSIAPEDVKEPESTESIEEAEEPAPAANGFIETTEPLQVMDSALYRGEILNISNAGDETILEIQQAPGTVFGPQPLAVHITPDTNLNFNIDDLAVGQYIEVYFGDIQTSESESRVDAIAINHLGVAEARVFNGIVKSITPNEDDPNQGVLLMESMDTGLEMVFHYNTDGTTNFYLDFDSIQEGSELSIFHNVAVTASLPPQTTAVEVRTYKLFS